MLVVARGILIKRGKNDEKKLKMKKKWNETKLFISVNSVSETMDEGRSNYTIETKISTCSFSPSTKSHSSRTNHRIVNYKQKKFILKKKKTLKLSENSPEREAKAVVQSLSVFSSVKDANKTSSQQ